MPRAAASAMRMPVKLPGPTPTAIFAEIAEAEPGLGQRLQHQRHQRLGVAAMHRPAARATIGPSRQSAAEQAAAAASSARIGPLTPWSPIACPLVSPGAP